MGVAVAQPLSPELVLVCPELRARALELLPVRDPDALFEVAPRPIEPAVVDRRAPRPLAVAAYVLEALLLGALRGTAMIAAIAVAAFLLAR